MMIMHMHNVIVNRVICYILCVRFAKLGKYLQNVIPIVNN